MSLVSQSAGRTLASEREAAAEAVPDAFGFAKSTVSRRFIRANATELRRLQVCRRVDAERLVPLRDAKSFAGEQLVIALGVTAMGEKRISGLVQTANEIRREVAREPRLTLNPRRPVSRKALRRR